MWGWERCSSDLGTVAGGRGKGTPTPQASRGRVGPVTPVLTPVTLMSDLWPQSQVRTRVCCLSHQLCGPLSWQPRHSASTSDGGLTPWGSGLAPGEFPPPLGQSEGLACSAAPSSPWIPPPRPSWPSQPGTAGSHLLPYGLVARAEPSPVFITAPCIPRGICPPRLARSPTGVFPHPSQGPEPPPTTHSRCPGRGSLGWGGVHMF